MPHLIFFTTALVMLAASCQKQGCIDSQALNYDKSAKIDDGSCQYLTDAFVGKFIGNEICDDSSDVNEELIVSRLAEYADRIVFQSISRFAIAPYAIVNGKNLIIPTQSVSSALISVNISGNGQIDNQQLTLNYTLTESGQTISCSFSGAK